MRLLLLLFAAVVLTQCVGSQSMRCSRVSAEEFMRPHGLKSASTDQFIGFTKPNPPGSTAELAFKMVRDVSVLGGGYPHSVMWCPVKELPEDYLRDAHNNPNRESLTDHGPTKRLIR